MKHFSPEIKKGLLINPDNLNSDYHLLSFIVVDKSKGRTDLNISPLIKKEVRHFFPQTPVMVQTVIEEFDSTAFSGQLAEIKNAVKKTGGDPSTVKATMLRHVHGKLERIKPLAPSVKWYHRFKAEEGNYKVFPATFSSYRPQLSFKVVKQGNELALETFVTINGTNFPLREFHQHKFLLRSNNEYFLLLFKDYKTLDWLSQFDFSLCNKSAGLFESELLSRLQDDYQVDRNNLLTDHEIAPVPVNRIYLNELSGSFLMITPQWKYDDFLVEGNFDESYKTTVNGKSYVIKRNKEKEEAFIQLLQSFHPNFPNQASKGYYYVSFADAQKKQWFLKTYHRLLELDIELTGLDMLKHFKLSAHKADTILEILEQTESRLLLRFNVSFGKEIIQLGELQKTLLAGQRAVLLKDGSLGVLGDEWLRQYSTIIKHGKVAKDTISVASWMAVNENKENGNLVLQKSIPDNWWSKWKQWQEPQSKIYELPSTLHANLRPYQHKGYEWMKLLAELGAGACLADDMGLGKTLQTISFICAQIESKSDAKCLIICPASLIYNWQSECNKFAPSLRTAVYHGPNRNSDCFSNNKDQVIISTYGTIRVDFEKIQEINFDVLVLDESHNIKNPSAQITQAVSELKAHHRVALSGTPVMNNTFDLYAQLNFTIPGMFGSKEFFKKEYADAIDISGDEEKLKALNKLTAPFILRRTKEQVAPDLPAKTEIIRWCEMSMAQKTQYEEIRDQVRSNLLDNIKKDGFKKSKLFLLQAITKLRQVCNSPLLLPENERTCTDSVKTSVLMDELVNNLGGHKSLVFSQFSSMLDLLAEECKQRGLSYFHFDGQTPAAKRAEMVEAFQSAEDTTPVFLISLKAGNAGLNLTAADYVFLFDPWWNTAVQQQAINRTHRIGQQKNVFAYQMICKDTIEEKIIAIQNRKQKLSEELIAEDGFLSELTEDEVMYLFS